MDNNRQIIFTQGMRRSGTTILFDILLEDGAFECFYEPLAFGKPTFGGGSGEHDRIDLFQNIRKARDQFLEEYPEWLQWCPEFRELNLFNYGAPRLAELEFEPDLPSYGRDYIKYLTRFAPRVFLKFTRMHSKIHILKQIAPGARLIHIVRDPRHVVMSYLFGRNARNRNRFTDEDHFFTRVSEYTAWSSKDFSDYILGFNEYGDLGECQDFLRILLIWKYKFERTHQAGIASFGDDYYLLRHDDLLSEPAETLKSIGEFMGKPFGETAMEWARTNIRGPAQVYAHRDKRWNEAYTRLNMTGAIEAAGYGELLD